MTDDDFVFGVVSPILAIGLQWYTFPPDGAIDRDADQLGARYNLPAPAVTAFAEMTKGAVTIAGVAPTIVSFASTVCVLFREEKKAAIDIFILLSLAIIIILLIVTMITKRTIFQLQTYFVPLPIKFGGQYTFTITYTRSIHLLVYIANISMIGLTVAVYRGFL